MLNVAPARKLDTEVLRKIDVLKGNETEAELLTGKKIEDIGNEELFDLLLDSGVKKVILTLGKQGCFFKGHEKSYKVRAFNVESWILPPPGIYFTVHWQQN